MKVNKIRKTKYGYTVYIEDERVSIENSIFSKFNIKTNQVIKKETWDEILKENEEAFIKRKSLMFLARRRSTKEFITYLNKLNAKNTLIKSLVKDYTNKGYLDDYLFAELLINKEEKRYGKQRLKSILIKKGIKNDIIDSLLSNHKDKNLEELVKKACKTVKADNYVMAERKLLSSFKRKGYKLNEIKDNINKHLKKEQFNEIETIKKHYLKALKKYEKKYFKNELNLKIKEVLYRKGFKLSVIEKTIRGE